MTEQTKEKLRQVKQSFRLYMNGVTAASMRQKGVDYHINWGLSAFDLKNMAGEIGKDYPLAVELWKENIRECKILAAMVMPPEQMIPELADVWMEQIPTLEIAEALAFYLLQYMSDAHELALMWLASTREYYRVCGFSVLARLFARHFEPSERDINEYLDQLITALEGDTMAVKKAAANSVRWFAQLGDEYSRIAKAALKRSSCDIL